MGVGDHIKVMIVDDVAETRENVRKLLQFETDLEVVGAARSGREAIQMAHETSPDVVLMDINMPDMDGITATEMIRSKLPFIQVVILSVQNDQNYMRRAMLAGARDFLTKPPMGDELVSAIRRAGEMARVERSKTSTSYSTPVAGGVQPGTTVGQANGRVIMVYSPKGGAGTTTLAINLTLALHNEETQAAIIDGNLQFGDVAVFLNEQGKNTILDLAMRADELDPEIVEEVMVKHASSGIHVLASPSKPEHAEKINSDQFGKLLQYLKRLYAYIVVDTTSFLTDTTLSILDVSDLIVLIVTQDIPAIKNARLFLDLINTLGVERDRVLFVMNKYDKRISITPEKVGENLKQEISAVVPLDERVVIPSVNRGVPFILDNKTQPSARGVFMMAESIRTKLTKLEEESEKVGRR